MTTPLDQYQDLLNEICEEWNRSEEVIKRVEQLVDGADIKATTPSINELRYAGRRVVEAISAIANGDTSERVQSLLRDARFDCHRAQHDAIDASFLAIRLKIETAEILLPMKALLTAFPGYPELKSVFTRVNDQVAQSRKNREDREAIYSSLQKIEFEKLLSLFADFSANESTMKAIAKEDRRARFKNDLFGYVGLASLVFTIVAWSLT